MIGTLFVTVHQARFSIQPGDSNKRTPPPPPPVCVNTAPPGSVLNKEGLQLACFYNQPTRIPKHVTQLRCNMSEDTHDLCQFKMVTS